MSSTCRLIEALLCYHFKKYPYYSLIVCGLSYSLCTFMKFRRDVQPLQIQKGKIIIYIIPGAGSSKGN